MDKESLLTKLGELDFAIVDLRLFLDTHPRDRAAITEYNKLAKQAKRVKEEYENGFGPLTAAGMSKNDYFNWIDGSWPWENA